MSSAMTLANLAIIATVLIKDWGHRKVTVFAVLRPLLITALIVPFVMPGWDLSGKGGLLVLGAGAVGAVLGLIASSLMAVSVDAKGQAWTDAGVPYAAFWIAVCLARQAFIYGCEHWFTRGLGEFLVNNHISVHSFADSILLFSLGMVITVRVAIVLRSRFTGVSQVSHAQALALWDGCDPPSARGIRFAHARAPDRRPGDNR